jgi:hypothetical protein
MGVGVADEGKWGRGDRVKDNSGDKYEIKWREMESQVAKNGAFVQLVGNK